MSAGHIYMSKTRARALAFTVVAAACAATGWAQVDPPLLGYLPDTATAAGQVLVRPVTGLPAAAAIEDPLDLGATLTRAVASPAGDYVIAVRDAVDPAGREVVVYTPAGGLRPLEGARPDPASIAVSPQGSAAVLWNASSLRAQIVTGLPEAPSIREIDAAFLGGLPQAVAISDEGAWLTGVWAGQVHAFGPQGEVLDLPMDHTVEALGFFPGQRDLLLAAAGGLVEIEDVGGRSFASVLIEAAAEPPSRRRPGRSVAVGAAVTGDRTRAVAAFSDGRIVDYDLTAGTVSETDCGCTPEGLFGMSGPAFRLTGLRNGSFKLFDPADASVLFVPLRLAASGGRP